MIKITEKQEGALNSMLKFLGKGEGAFFDFESYEEFQAFFKDLQKKCKRKEIIMKKVQKNKELGIKKEYKQKVRTKESLEKYCNKLFESYGYGFYSQSKLKNKLLQKTKDLDIVNELLESFNLTGKIDEEALKERKVKSKLKQGFGSGYIRQKLMQAGIKDTSFEVDKDEEYKNLENLAEKIISKYDLKDYKEKQKFITKLYSKGFGFDLINRFLKEKKD